MSEKCKGYDLGEYGRCLIFEQKERKKSPEEFLRVQGQILHLMLERGIGHLPLELAALVVQRPQNGHSKFLSFST